MDLARRTLCEVVSAHGPGIAREPRRLENLLNDLCGEERKAIFVLVHAARERLPEDIEPAVTRGAPALQIERSARRLAESLGFDTALARWAAETWALALGAGCGSPEPIKVAAQGGAPFQTLTAALRHAPPWARIEVAPGLYAESLVLERPVEIVAATGGAAVQIQAAEGAALRLQADFAVLRGVTLRGGPIPSNASGSVVSAGSGGSSGSSGSGGSGGESRDADARQPGHTLFTVDVPHGELLLEDCDVSGGELACIAARGKNAHIALRRCRIHGGRQAGLYVSLGGAGVIAECEIVENGGAGVEIGWQGSPILRRCRVARNGTYGVRIYAGGNGTVEDCDLAENRLGAWCVEEEHLTA